MKMICPCCAGEGRITILMEVPVRMAPLPSRVYRAIAARPNALGARELVPIVYGDQEDGGPLTAMATIHTMVCLMNKRLAKVGERIRADKRGSGATYSIEKLDVV